MLLSYSDGTVLFIFVPPDNTIYTLFSVFYCVCASLLTLLV